MDGAVYFKGQDESQLFSIYRLDPATGDRSLYLSLPDGGSLTEALVYPAPSFFPPNVASLGTWGLAMLLVGIFIGVQLRMRNHAEA